MSGSVQVTPLLPSVMLVLLAASQWSLLLWAESTVMAVVQDSARAAAVLGGSAEDGREARRRALFNSALGDAIVKVDRVAAFMTAVVEEAAIRVFPMVGVTVHQAARVPAERIQ